MPVIQINVLGRALEIGNGSLEVDGRLFPRVKHEQIIPVSEGYHSIKYSTTNTSYGRSEWTTNVNFDNDTFMIANVINERSSAPSFVYNNVGKEKIEALIEESKKQKEREEAKQKKESRRNKIIVACIIVAIIIFLIIIL